MSDGIIFISVLTVAILVSITFEIQRRKRLEKYWLRSCLGAEWKHKFPNISSDEIRAFLELFVDAFAFSSKKRLKFGPDDRVMDIYRTLYPSTGGCDALELETFSMMLEKTYGFAPLLSSETTLGQVFETIQSLNE